MKLRSSLLDLRNIDDVTDWQSQRSWLPSWQSGMLQMVPGSATPAFAESAANSQVINLQAAATGGQALEVPPRQSDMGCNAAATAPAPVITSTSLTQVLYLHEAGDTTLISVHDINQGQLGDCYLLSSIGQLALFHPSAITNMILPNANGTEMVTLHLAANGSLPSYGTTAFKATTVTVTNNFPNNSVNNGATQDVLNGQKEIWVQVLENAVATLGGGYNSIANGGNPMIAMEELTGQTATFMSPAWLTLSELQGYIAAGDLIVMDTPASGSLPYGLYNDHAYMFESLTMVSSTAMVQMGNPWGFDQPSLIPLSQLSSGFVEADIGLFVDSNSILGTAGNDNTTLPNPVTNASIDLGAELDTLTFATGTNSATVANTETIIGGAGNDAITVSTAAVSTSVDLAAGNDTLTFGNFTNTATVANTETITGGTGNDTITLATALTTAMAVNLGTGANALTLAAGGNTATVSNTNTLIGGSGADAITLGAAVSNGSIDLGAGSDTLTLANLANTATVSNVETIAGGSANDSVTLGSALTTAMSVDLGTGSNKLTLANAANTGSVGNASTLIGGTGADTITLGTALTNGSVDLGAGQDSLTLANGTNSATVANVETVIGGNGDDNIVLTGIRASTVIAGGGMNFITANSCADTFVLDPNATGTTTITNFSAARGDTIELASAGCPIVTSSPGGLGVLAMTNSVDIAMVADNAALLAETLPNGSAGGFVYEQDSGGLYYNSAGNFSGGGTLIGTITGNGSTPWTYDASRFIQV